MDDTSSITFAAFTKFLATFLTDKGEYTLPAGQLDDGSDLKAVVARLPLETLTLTGANIATSPDDGTWTLTGTPTAPWAVPSFDDLFVDMAGAVATLTVTDATAAPDIDLQLAGNMTLGASLLVGLVLDLRALSSSTTIGTPEHSIPLDAIIAHLKASAPAWTGLRALLPSGLDFSLVSATLSTSFAAEQPSTPQRRDRRIIGTVSLGKVTLQVEIETETDKEAEPTVTMSWPVDGQPAPASTLNEVLGALGLPFDLPDPLDRPLGSFAIASTYVDLPNQLNPNDTRRLILSMPNVPEPDFRVCCTMRRIDPARFCAATGRMSRCRSCRWSAIIWPSNSRRSFSCSPRNR